MTSGDRSATKRARLIKGEEKARRLAELRRVLGADPEEAATRLASRLRSIAERRGASKVVARDDLKEIVRRHFPPRVDCPKLGRVASRENCPECDRVFGQCTEVLRYVPTRLIPRQGEPEAGGEASASGDGLTGPSIGAPAGPSPATTAADVVSLKQSLVPEPARERPAAITIGPEIEALLARRKPGPPARTDAERDAAYRRDGRIGYYRKLVRRAAAAGDRTAFDKAVAKLRAELADEARAEEPPAEALVAPPRTPEDQPLRFRGEDAPPPAPEAPQSVPGMVVRVDGVLTGDELGPLLTGISQTMTATQGMACRRWRTEVRITPEEVAP